MLESSDIARGTVQRRKLMWFPSLCSCKEIILGVSGCKLLMENGSRMVTERPLGIKGHEYHKAYYIYIYSLSPDHQFPSRVPILRTFSELERKLRELLLLKTTVWFLAPPAPTTGDPASSFGLHRHHTPIYTHAHTHVQCTHMNMHTRAHAHMHTCTQAHTHAHIYINLYKADF